MSMTKPTHGGRRDGAGRKHGYKKPGARHKQVNIRLTDEEHDKALAIGNGNASKGLRDCLNLVPRP